MSQQKNTSWMVWGTAVLLVVGLAYPLSLGPLVALSSSSIAESTFTTLGPRAADGIMVALSIVYWPLELASDRFPNAIGTPLQTYVDWWTPASARAAAIPSSAPLPAAPMPPALPAEAL